MMKTKKQSLSGYIRQNLESIEEQIYFGISHDSIVEKLLSIGQETTLDTFRSALYRARKQVQSTQKGIKMKTQSQKAVHFTLQGKGGVGKSLISSILAQFFISAGKDVKCIDADPVNQTLISYKSLNAQSITLIDDKKINERNFDKLIERFVSEDGVFVVDNGASTFVPLSNYIIENNVFSILKENNIDVFVHTVLTGSQALLETLEGFRALAEQKEIKNIIVWLNEFFGDIVLGEGKQFTEMKVYTNNAEKVHGIIRIPRRNHDTFVKDIEVMSTKKLTFNEVLESPDFSLMARQRIKTVQRDLYDQLSKIEF